MKNVEGYNKPIVILNKNAFSGLTNNKRLDNDIYFTNSSSKLECQLHSQQEQGTNSKLGVNYEILNDNNYDPSEISSLTV